MKSVQYKTFSGKSLAMNAYDMLCDCVTGKVTENNTWTLVSETIIELSSDADAGQRARHRAQ